MLTYYETETKRFVNYNPYTKWEVQGEPSSDMKKAALDYYRGLRDTAHKTKNTELLESNLIIKVERWEDKENKTLDYTITTYMEIGKTEFTWLEGEEE